VLDDDIIEILNNTSIFVQGLDNTPDYNIILPSLFSFSSIMKKNTE